MGILKNSSIDDDFSEYLTKNNVKHIRIPLYSAWIGSMWERMIRSIKSCLSKTVGRKQLEYFNFKTVLSDVTNALNSRPLTYRNNDDLTYDVLTPNSFLKVDNGRSVLFGQVTGSEIKIPRRSELVSALDKRENALDHFKELWYTEYLVSLRETGKDFYQEKWVNRIEIDDVVLISDPIKSRHHWKLGRVLEKITGYDGIVRSVKLVKPDRTTAVHAVCHLYPMELSVASQVEN